MGDKKAILEINIGSFEHVAGQPLAFFNNLLGHHMGGVANHLKRARPAGAAALMFQGAVALDQLDRLDRDAQALGNDL